jgi:hypothetical protein
MRGSKAWDFIEFLLAADQLGPDAGRFVGGRPDVDCGAAITATPPSSGPAGKMRISPVN